jgi:hypothetical protein
MGGAFAMDFGAVLAMARARGADEGLIADVLAPVESVRIASLRQDDEPKEAERE